MATVATCLSNYMAAPLHCTTQFLPGITNSIITPKAVALPRLPPSFRRSLCCISSSAPPPLTDVSAAAAVSRRVARYRFLTEDGATVVNAVVSSSSSSSYSVSVEVVPSSFSSIPPDNPLELLWSTSRHAIDGAGGDFPKIGLSINASGRQVAELQFDSAQAPLYLSFLLNDVANSRYVKTHRKTSFCIPVGINRGSPSPLGFSISADGSANFALFSQNADSVTLCLYDSGGRRDSPSVEIELDPYINRTGDVWHVSLDNPEHFATYGYRCDGSQLWHQGARFHMRHVLLDPYAKMVDKFIPDQDDMISFTKCLAHLKLAPSFDWNGDAHPCLQMEELVVYRANVSMFSDNGTFSSLIGKIDHLTTLGINALLLEPIFPFVEDQGPYFPYHFFSPMQSYCDEGNGMNSMKEMVKAMHSQGIEVILEVPFSHTCEGGDAAPQMICFRGIDNSSYYFADSSSSSLNTKNPVVHRLILDCLRHWVVEFRVDGFCFVNSSCLLQGSGVRPALAEAIAFDPILSKTKIIADSWSQVNYSCSAVQFPHWKKWAEVNPRFSTDIRNFLRGQALLSDLATRVCGSGDLFVSRGPSFSFNYITRNTGGLPLVDLVSFSSNKLSSELSWNCGEEGPSSNPIVLEIRLRQIRNFLFLLFLSLGVPVLNMGDECGYSCGGSPSSKHRRPINWSVLKNTPFSNQIIQFITYLSTLRRRRSDIFQRREFLKLENLQWQGSGQTKPEWNNSSHKFLSLMLKVEAKDDEKSINNGDVFVCFNASSQPEKAVLPRQPEGVVWNRLVDTSLPFPGFFMAASSAVEDSIPADGLLAYEVKSHSCALFEAKNTHST